MMSYLPNQEALLFRKILKFSLSSYLLLGVILTVIRLPVLKHPDVRNLSDRVAKLILEPPKVLSPPPIPSEMNNPVKPKPEKKTRGKQKGKPRRKVKTKPRPKQTTEIAKKKAAPHPSAKRNREIIRKSGLLASFIEEEASGGLNKIIEDKRLDRALSQSDIISVPASSNKKNHRPVMQGLPKKRNVADKQIAGIGGLKKEERVTLAKREEVAVTQFSGSGGDGVGNGGFGGNGREFGSGVRVRLNGNGSGNALIDYDAIARIVEKYKGGLIYLYNKELRSNPTLKGTVTVEFSINEDGKVIDAHITTSTMDNARLETAVARRIKRWKFPKLYDGIVVVTYPFIFFPV